MTPAAARTVESDSRSRIVTAAFRVLVRDGYEAASVKEIAREAGVAPGLVHYYFDTKEDLLLATVDDACQRFLGGRLQELRQKKRDGVEGMTPSQEARESLELNKEAIRKGREFWILIMEMYSRALYEPKIRSAIRDFIKEDRAEIERIVRGVMRELGRDPGVPADAIAAAIYGSIHGIVMQKLLDPKFDADAAIDALSTMAFALGRPGS